MGRYVQLYTDLWSDAAVDELEHDNKFLYIYLLTSPESNLIGYYRIMPRQIASDIGSTKEKVLSQLLTETKLWKYDQNTNQVLLPGFLKYSKVKSPGQIDGLNRELKSIPKGRLHKDFFMAIKRYCGEDAFQYIDKDLIKYVVGIIQNDLKTDKSDWHDPPLLELLSKYI